MLILCGDEEGNGQLNRKMCLRHLQIQFNKGMG